MFAILRHNCPWKSACIGKSFLWAEKAWHLNKVWAILVGREFLEYLQKFQVRFPVPLEKEGRPRFTFVAKLIPLYWVSHPILATEPHFLETQPKA